MTAYELVIVDTVHPGKPPLTMNEYERANRWVKSDAKKRIHYQILQALQKSPVPELDRVRVTITQYAPDARVRDADGLSAFRKFALDALRRHGVFPDDNTKHVADGGNFIEVDRTNPRITLTLETF